MSFYTNVIIVHEIESAVKGVFYFCRSFQLRVTFDHQPLQKQSDINAHYVFVADEARPIPGCAGLWRALYGGSVELTPVSGTRYEGRFGACPYQRGDIIPVSDKQVSFLPNACVGERNAVNGWEQCGILSGREAARLLTYRRGGLGVGIVNREGCQ